MGYNNRHIVKDIENYIQRVFLDRDTATIEIHEGEGVLTPPEVVNDAGQQYHIAEGATVYKITIADLAAAGEDLSAVLALDDQMRALAERMVAWKKAQQ